MWVPRLLAPLAFFAAATILILIVHNSLRASPQEAANGVATTPTAGNPAGNGTRTGAPQGKKKQQQKKRFYRVKQGDTLESIAARFDTTVEELLELNPKVDPLTLSPGQRIRVR